MISPLLTVENAEKFTGVSAWQHQTPNGLECFNSTFHLVVRRSLKAFLWKLLGCHKTQAVDCVLTVDEDGAKLDKRRACPLPLRCEAAICDQEETTQCSDCCGFSVNQSEEPDDHDWKKLGK